MQLKRESGPQLRSGHGKATDSGPSEARGHVWQCESTDSPWPKIPPPPLPVLVGLAVTCLWVVTCLTAYGQTPDSSKVKLDDIEVTFLTSYYQQDGNHSPVTGGIGTEYLTNIAPSVILNIPLDTMNTLNVKAGVDYYTSASSDNINNPFLAGNHVSGASAADTRTYATVSWKNKNKHTGVTKSVNAGVSVEFDVTSLSIGASYARLSKDENTEFNASASYFFDRWLRIYPVEFRNGTDQFLPTNLRHTGTFSLTGSRVLNRRMNVSLTSDVVVQSGILSTPFHRVYFQGEERPRIEMLPDFRVKVPVGLRFHYHVTDFAMVRTWYRNYNDTWGLSANSIQVEMPLKLTRTFRLYPFYRFHQQSAARYFKPFGQHTMDEQYFTSDYDLSDFTSQKLGMGLSVEPLYGVLRFKGRKQGRYTLLKRIDLRAAYYERSDGLNAMIYSAAFKFNLHR